MNIANLFNRPPRRVYTKQPPRCYWPVSPWDNRMCGYSERLPVESQCVIDAAQHERLSRCYVVRGLSLHTPQGREWLRSWKALLPQPGSDGPPMVRERYEATATPCIPPGAMRLLMRCLCPPAPMPKNKDPIIWLIQTAAERAVARAMVNLFSKPEWRRWLIFRGGAMKRRAVKMMMWGMVQVDSRRKGAHHASKSVPAHGPGKIASTVK